MPHIPWNEELETLLLHCVIVQGAHICGGKKVTETWNSANEMFFDQDDTKNLRTLHYKANNPRKLRDKYSNVMEVVQRDIETGNQSGKEGDLSLLYQHVNQIAQDIEEKDAKKDAANDLREKLNATEKDVLASSGPLKRKLISGEIIDNTSGEKRGRRTFNDELLSIMKAMDTEESSAKTNTRAQDEFEQNFTSWVFGSHLTLEDLLTAGEVRERFHDDVEDIGLKTLLNIYCCTQRVNFDDQTFKKELQAMELPMVVCSKLYMALQGWRRQHQAQQRSLWTTEPLTTPSGSSSSTSVSSLSMTSMN